MNHARWSPVKLGLLQMLCANAFHFCCTICHLNSALLLLAPRDHCSGALYLCLQLFASDISSATFCTVPYFACRRIVLSATIHFDQVVIDSSNQHIFLALVDLLSCNSSGRHTIHLVPVDGSVRLSRKTCMCMQTCLCTGDSKQNRAHVSSHRSQCCRRCCISCLQLQNECCISLWSRSRGNGWADLQVTRGDQDHFLIIEIAIHGNVGPTRVWRSKAST